MTPMAQKSTYQSPLVPVAYGQEEYCLVQVHLYPNWLFLSSRDKMDE